MIDRNDIRIGPGRRLFIYYLKGRLKAENQTFQENFIGNWEEENDTFLFFTSPAIRQIQDLLSRQPLLNYVDSYEMSYDQWLGEVFTAFEHGPFRVKPLWDVGQAVNDGKQEILLDPGLAFGTGTHPTTRDCLEALVAASGTRRLETVLDLGTGTGLLALAAARLGSKGVLAVDLNLLAAKTAARNVQLNRLEDRVLIIQGKAQEFIASPADLVIANIHYDVMRHLVDTEGFLEKRRFILSGLLRSEAKDIAGRLSRHGVELLKQWTRDGIWHTFYGSIQEYS